MCDKGVKNPAVFRPDKNAATAGVRDYLDISVLRSFFICQYIRTKTTTKVEY